MADAVLMANTQSLRRVPAEWEPQECVWLSWPCNSETWPGRFERIPDFYANWVRVIAESTPVRILADGEVARQCESLTAGVANVDIVPVATNDCWIRDYGPTFVEAGPSRQLTAVDWRFNSWGGKYPPWDLDDAAGAKLAKHAGLPLDSRSICLEGGAIEVDGGGRMLTVGGCLLSPSRNQTTKEEMVLELYRHLGILEIVWIDGGGLEGDDTDGHIDQLARFIDNRNVVVAVCNDPNDSNADGLEENFRQLRLWGQSTSPRVTVHRLPIPPARTIDDTRVPESYCNFLRLGRERLLVPTFGAESDDNAIALLRDLTGAEVVPIDCRDLAWGLGAVHCASRDQPRSPQDR